MRIFPAKSLLLLCTALTSVTTYAQANDDNLRAQAQKIAHRYPLIDGHIDVPYRLQEHWEDVTKATAMGDFDLPRAQQGGLSAPFMSIYTPADSESGNAGVHATALAHVLIDQVEAIAYRAPDKFAITHTSSELQKNFAQGKISLLLGMENGAPIAGDLANLQAFYARGIRYITLTHGLSNHIADSSYDKVRLWHGLSPFGQKLITEMNNTGVIIDIAHVSDEAFYEVLKLSKVPVIASHSSLRHFTPGMERNVSDDMLKALAKNGGVIMINFGSYFVSEAAHKYVDAEDIAETGFKKLHYDKPSDAALKHFKAQYRERAPYPFATLAMVADHFDHAVKLVGIDHVGIGSDFDGVGDSLPTSLKTVADYPNLLAELLKRGYSEADLAKIMSGNVLRVMTAVESYAEKAKAKK